jgi:hypothetical protein
MRRAAVVALAALSLPPLSWAAPRGGVERPDPRSVSARPATRSR